VEIGEADAFVVEAIEIGRLEDGVAVAREVAVALVVAQDEEDVGAFAGELLGGRVDGEEEEREEEWAHGLG
jgi:hypothetical protein